ncbi:hypothetical protein E2C01_059963 [Portunus trituberculatus]|uniref:Uncharacterized protein n=1 Tax=Portunus trituberculatus TaxID=210409 RepID=A0A5B7H973_PORTR|nr:hypothetical protein [Portunus trituberculatus]
MYAALLTQELRLLKLQHSGRARFPKPWPCPRCLPLAMKNSAEKKKEKRAKRETVTPAVK